MSRAAKHTGLLIADAARRRESSGRSNASSPFRHYKGKILHVAGLASLAHVENHEAYQLSNALGVAYDLRLISNAFGIHCKRFFDFTTPANVGKK